MKEVQNGARTDSALDELCKRYEDRTKTFDRSPAYAEQLSREISTRSTAPRSYKFSSGTMKDLHEFKNGVAGNRKYMTERDFANYYRATREYTPESNVELESVILLQRIDRDRYNKTKALPDRRVQKPNVKAQLIREANRSNPKTVDTRMLEMAVSGPKRQRTKESVKRVAKKAAKTWIPIDERKEEKTVRGKPTRMPTDMILAIFVITVSLLLIVGSTVLLGSARREQSELNGMLKKLDGEISQLEDELMQKNKDADIEIYANEHGMISNEHIGVEYINTDKEDGLNTSEAESFSLSALLKWFFSNLR